MKGMTRVAMGVALAVALGLAVVLVLLVVLLGDLFCTLYGWRRRRQRRSELHSGVSAAEAPAPPQDAATPASKPLDRTAAFPFYGHGVIHAPRRFLLTVPKLEAAAAPPGATADQVECGAYFYSSPVMKSPKEGSFVCISNPIYDKVCPASGEVNEVTGTPFETPGTSPSHLDDAEEEGEEEKDGSPPLYYMKKLPRFVPLASSMVYMVDNGRRSLATSASATDTNRPSSSSSSNSPCSSPPW